MRTLRLTSFVLALLAIAISTFAYGSDILIRNVVVYDGTGTKAFKADVRIKGDRITAIAKMLTPQPGETVRDEHGMALAPGFIDMHSHHDQGIFNDLDAEAVTHQGVTTVFVGQDGDSNFPISDFFTHLEKTPAAVNFATMVGHATVRKRVMGEDLYRPATAQEIERMKDLVRLELRAGAFGLSSGLEYEEGHFATTEEMVELAKVAASEGGFYISHVRDEANKVFDSYEEITRIGREAKLPVEISHIKLGSTSVWHQTKSRMPNVFEKAEREGVDLKADVYPYTFWASTLRVLITDRDFFNAEKVSQSISENGGPGNLRISLYKPEPAMAGKTLDQIAAAWKVTPTEAYMRMIKATESEISSGEQQEGVLGTSMSEDDVSWFISYPHVMFCSDGELHGGHPRGAGSFPRVLGRYVREQHALSLEDAVHKMTEMPARQLHLIDRGRVAEGYIADLVIFDPATVADRSTVDHPDLAPLGIPDVMVSGAWVVEDGKSTGDRPGRVIRHKTTF